MDQNQLQQPVLGTEDVYEPPVHMYDEAFPALPNVDHVVTGVQMNNHWSLQPSVGTTIETHVFRVPVEERKYKEVNDTFGGQSEQAKICSDIMLKTRAHIEVSSSKDQSLTFVITGKHDCVLEARRKILEKFQTQASQFISIPKEHHRFILGKQGKRLGELERMTSTKINVPKPDENSDQIKILGSKEGIEKALHEIRVISDEQSKQAYETVDLPKCYHPFIQPTNHAEIGKIVDTQSVRVNIPPISFPSDRITIAGEKEGVLRVKQLIQSAYDEMEAKYISVSVEVKKSQHKYIIGPKGNTINEIFTLTGICVEMPSNDSSSETITLRGPPDKLGEALKMVHAKANSFSTVEVPVPSWLNKFIIGKGGGNIKQITQDLPKVHFKFTDEEDKIKLDGPTEEVKKAQLELENIAKELLSQLSFAEIAIDSSLNRYFTGKQKVNINKLKDKHGVVIKLPDFESSGVLRIEGKTEGVKMAEAELRDICHKLETEKQRDIIIEQRLHKNIIGPKGETITEIRTKFEVTVVFPDAVEKRDVVSIRGNKENVDACYTYLMKMAKELHETNYQVVVPIFKTLKQQLRISPVLKKIREESNVRIIFPQDNNENNLTILGVKQNVAEAEASILKLQSELANVVHANIIIPSKFHMSIIGAGGKIIKSIASDCGGVHISFPDSDSNSDQVTISGPKEDVEKAKKMLLEMTNEKQLSSFSVKITAKPQHHKFLIGKGGVNIKKVREATGVRVIFPSEMDADKNVIEIIGKKENVMKAKEILEASIQDLGNIIESEVSVDPKHHRHFIARRGEVIHEVSDQFGGVTISFPRRGDQSDKVTLTGAKDCVEGAKARILEIVEDLKQIVTIQCVIPQKYHRMILGPKGSRLQIITCDYDVKIKFPERNMDPQEHNGDVNDMVNGDLPSEEPKPCDIILITGKPDNCHGAHDALLALKPIVSTMDIPYDFHRYIIGQKGKDVRELMDNCDVSITIPPSHNHSDEVKIVGTSANVEKAKEALKERVAQLESEKQDRILRSFQLTIEVDPKYHPKIIGRRGAVISKLRDEHEVQIQFPKKGDPEENVIIITGYEKNAEAAKADILNIIAELESMVEEAVQIDHRCHSRLIGQRGHNASKLMDQFKVDLRFPRSAEDPDTVYISGAEDDVLDAKEALLNLAEEYMQDIVEEEYLASFKKNRSKDRDEEHQSSGQSTSFVVKGGPWEQKAPDMESNEDFPTIGDMPLPTSNPIPWGPRR